jgi:ribosomal protein L34E
MGLSITPSARTRIRYRYKLKLINNNHISKGELKNVPELKNMAIFRQPQGTNFPVTDTEWEVISDLANQRLNQSR